MDLTDVNFAREGTSPRKVALVGAHADVECGTQPFDLVEQHFPQLLLLMFPPVVSLVDIAFEDNAQRVFCLIGPERGAVLDLFEEKVRRCAGLEARFFLGMGQPVVIIMETDRRGWGMKNREEKQLCGRNKF